MTATAAVLSTLITVNWLQPQKKKIRSTTTVRGQGSMQSIRYLTQIISVASSPRRYIWAWALDFHPQAVSTETGYRRASEEKACWTYRFLSLGPRTDQILRENHSHIHKSPHCCKSSSVTFQWIGCYYICWNPCKPDREYRWLDGLGCPGFLASYAPAAPRPYCKAHILLSSKSSHILFSLHVWYIFPFPIFSPSNKVLLILSPNSVSSSRKLSS